LTALSQRLAATLRAGDNLVRWGGEEFLAVLDSISPEQADLTVARLLGAVRQDPLCAMAFNTMHDFDRVRVLPMTGSIGGIRLETAIRLVDKALYEAKRRGRDRACRVGALGAGKVPNLSVVSNRPDATDADFPIHFVEMVVAA